MGELGSMWTPHHRYVIGWKQTHHIWVGECVAKPPPTGDRTHHLQRIEWESSMASPETGTPSRSFPLAISSSLVLVKGFQETGGVPANHKLLNQKFTNRHQLFMYNNLAQQQCLSICANLWIPSTTANLLLKLEVPAWNFMLPQQNGFGPKFLHSLLR